MVTYGGVLIGIDTAREYVLIRSGYLIKDFLLATLSGSNVCASVKHFLCLPLEEFGLVDSVME
jgi:hypothetical protein